MTVVLEAKNVSLEYKTRTGFLKKFIHKAVDDVSFTVNKGEIFGVLGRNGSGKSSLLTLLAGVVEPDQGQIVTPENTSISLLTLGLGFNPMLSGRDNTLISCMLNGYSKQESLNYIEAVKEFSELEHFFEQPVKTYSAGMRSRLGFSTALLTNVDVLLVDETLSVGDKNFKHKAEAALLEKLNSNQTVIFVSHNEAQVQKLCDRALWLDGGKVIVQGRIDGVIEAYTKNN